MNQKPKIWKGYEELNNSSEFEENKHNEFPEKLPLKQLSDDVETFKAPRRDFLKFMGFSLTAATVAAGCEMPVKKAIPYLNKPEDVTPGMSTWYASTYAECGDYCSVLVKSRDGRPIKIEGNPQSSVTKGGTSARVQASVLDLYDNSRLIGPMTKLENKWKAGDWNIIDEEIRLKLSTVKGKVVVLSGSILSPSTKEVIKGFLNKQESSEHIVFDAISSSGILDANELCFGIRGLPDYQFKNADCIVSFGADFLGSWLSPVEYAKGYAYRRKINDKNWSMSKHFQFEGNMSMTGTNADYRFFMKPSEEKEALQHLYNLITETEAISVGALPKKLKSGLRKTAKELKNSMGSSLVVSGSNNKYIQSLVNLINYELDSYGSTISFTRLSNYRQGNDVAMFKLVEDMAQGKIGAVILWDANPAYNYYNTDEFKKAYQNVGLKISLNAKLDETAMLSDYACPDHHYLESWNDAEPKSELYSLSQPVIAPLFKTRSGSESILRWSGVEKTYYEYVKAYWKKNIHKISDGSFTAFWDKCLHDGVCERDSKGNEANELKLNVGQVNIGYLKLKSIGGKTDLDLYENVSVGNGNRANNPWLQELPDPVTKVTWDNYAMISRKKAQELGLSQEDVIRITSGDVSIELPVLVQPGQKDEVIGVAMGYGRKMAGRIFDKKQNEKVRLSHADYANLKDPNIDDYNFTSEWGSNAFPMVQWNGENFIYHSEVSIEATGKTLLLAQTQSHHHINPGVRPIVREVSYDSYLEDPYAGYAKYKDVEVHKKDGTSEVSRELIKSGEDEYKRIKHTRHQNLYYDPKDKGGKTTFPGHHWGMNIDMNSCIGCNACVVSCNAENNIPVVGKHEVSRRHDMHWIRIDRYYVTQDDMHEDDADENPRVIHQPMLCQHCDNAPCENVCPVAATNHSSEGLNQMAYNRCVGTRYCENNCPYKVRRFNWYDYTGQDNFAWNEAIHDTYRNDNGDDIDDLTKMVLNPDVTIRARGVIEKCSFCVQRIQEGKLSAKKDGRKLADGDIKVACQTACPTDAIVFGDMNDKNSQVSINLDSERNFHVIEEVHTLPSVGYLTKVRNINKKELNA
jgi:molybdopterin-containing oxidoreductase family iron-sulfur binding subunit